MLKKIIRAILLAPVLLLLLFEEWGWEPLARAIAALGRLPWLGRLGRFIERLPPWAALLAFGGPVLLLLPIKLLALYLIGQGQVVLGVTVVIAAKITGTALAARLFQLTQPALMQLAWFARLYTGWKRWKDALLAKVRASKPWRALAAANAHLKAVVKRVFSQFSAKAKDKTD